MFKILMDKPDLMAVCVGAYVLMKEILYIQNNFPPSLHYACNATIRESIYLAKAGKASHFTSYTK